MLRDIAANLIVGLLLYAFVQLVEWRKRRTSRHQQMTRSKSQVNE